MERRALVLGGGVDGLVAAAALARAGMAVTVLEAETTVGGLAARRELFPGVHLPIGHHHPVALTPEVVAATGLVVNRLPRRGLCDDTWVVRPGGERVCIAADRYALQQELERVSPADSERLSGFIAEFAALSRMYQELLRLAPAPGQAPRKADLWELIKVAWRGRGQGPDSLQELLRVLPLCAADLLGEWFKCDALRTAWALKCTEFSTLGPWSAGGGMRLLQAFALGYFSELLRPPRQLLLAADLLPHLVEAVTAAKGVIRTGVSVQEIQVQDGSVRGVSLRGGEEVAADLVVSEAHPRLTLEQWLDPRLLEPSLRQDLSHYRLQPHFARVFFALNKLPAFLAPGGNRLAIQAVLAEDMDQIERGADAVKYGEPAAHPVLDVSAPALADESLAPPKTAGLSVIVHGMPPSREQGAGPREALVRAVVDELERYEPGFKATIRTQEAWTADDLARRFPACGGHLHHGDLTLDQSLVLRPTPQLSRYATPVGGLYLCGPSTPPGGGVSGVCGALAARRILQDLRMGKRLPI